MRTRTLAAGLLAAAALTLTACSSSGGNTDGAPKQAATKVATGFDCNDPNLSDADRTANCTGPDNGSGGALHNRFGQTYTWPDGVKATVISARRFTDYDTSTGEHATAGETDFRVQIRITNGSQSPLDLTELSTIIDGATNGGEAAATTFNRGSAPLEGLLAPGVTAVKTDDDVLEKKYGLKIVVKVQRDTAPFPDFTGTITG